MPISPRLRRILFRFAAPALALTVTCLVCEIALRLGGFGRTYTNPMSAFFEPDEERGCRGKANVRGRFCRLDFNVMVEHNENGFRRGVPVAEGAAQHDVYVLGDSFVWGYGVGQDDLLTNQMARLLKYQRVHNLGMAGAGTVEECLILKRHVLDRLAPGDTVVLVFNGNDFSDNIGLIMDDRTHAILENGQVRLVPPPEPSESVLWQHRLRDGSNLVNLLAYCVDTIQYRRSVKLGPRAVGNGPSPEQIRRFVADDSPAYQITRHYLAEMKKACAEKRARFLAANVPGQAELAEDDVTSTNDLSLPGEIACREAFESLVRDLDIESVDLMEPMRAAKRTGRFDRMTFVHDYHWCPAGHTLAAEVIATAIAQK